MPAIASSSSLWPLPATPAMPTISPARTVKRSLRDAQHAARRSMTERSSTSSMACARRARRPSRRAAARGGRPSARRARPARSSAVSSVADHLAAAHDRDAVGHRHDLAQLVGDEDDGLALFLQRRSRPKSASASAGVSTAVGSSRMRMSAPRYERLQDFDPLLQADRAARRRSHRDRRRARSRAQAAPARRAPSRRRRRSSTPPSAPSMTFSSTVSGSTSMKCWWTMPMPARIASAGERIADGLPLTRISPESAS